MQKLIRPLSIEIQEELWLKYKEMIPRTIRLNDSIVALIEKEVSKRLKKDLKQKRKNHNFKIKPLSKNNLKSENNNDKEAKEVGTDHDF